MSHQTITEGLCYLGFMSASENPRLILEGCKNLIAKYMAHHHANGTPLIVNTMGWVTGLGLSLLQSILHMLPVTHLVAFSQGDANPYEYVQQALFEASPYTKPFSANEAPQVAYVSPSPASGTAATRLRRYTPSELRSMTFSAYFLGKFDRAEDIILYENGSSFRCEEPIEVSLDSIRVFKGNRPMNTRDGIELLSLNLAVVALAHTSNGKTRPLNSISLGVIRSIDQNSRKIRILTPLSPEDLNQSKVNAIIIGSQYLPSTFLQTPENVNGPYLNYTESNLPALPGSGARKTRNNIGRKYNQ